MCGAEGSGCRLCAQCEACGGAGAKGAGPGAHESAGAWGVLGCPKAPTGSPCFGVAGRDPVRPPHRIPAVLRGEFLMAVPVPWPTRPASARSGCAALCTRACPLRVGLADGRGARR
jgi:hypothetical protein